MAHSSVPFGRIKEVLDAGKAASTDVGEPVRIAVELAPGAPVDLVDALKAALVPETPHGMVHVGVLSQGSPVLVNPESDVCILVCGTDTALAAGAARAWTGSGVPTCLVAASAVEVPDTAAMGGARPGTAVASDPVRAMGALASWLVGNCDKAMALAANFPFCRRPAAQSEVLSCAAANAGVGAVDLIKGADFPIMCATEATMAIKIASMYGYGAGTARVPELAFVLVGGMAMRAAARMGTRVLPQLSWAVRGAVGWGGTYLVGQALMARFEAGSAFDGRAAWAWERVKEAADAAASRVVALTGRVVEVEPGAVYTEPGFGLGRSSLPVEVVDVDSAGGRKSWFEVDAGTVRRS